MHLSSVIPANDTRESVFGLRNFPRHERGSNLRPLAPEASALITELPRFRYITYRHRLITSCTMIRKVDQTDKCGILLNTNRIKDFQFHDKQVFHDCLYDKVTVIERDNEQILLTPDRNLCKHLQKHNSLSFRLKMIICLMKSQNCNNQYRKYVC